MRDEELRRRMGQVAEYGEHAVSPPDPAVVYRRARRRVTRLTALSVLLACALLGGGLAVRTSLAGDDRYPAVTVPPGPPTTAVPPTTASAATTGTSTTAPPAAPARFPSAPPMVGDAEGTVLAAQLVTRDSGWALTTAGLAWTGDGARSWRTITPGKVPAGRVRGAFFLDPRTGWMVASARQRETGSQVQLAVYRTGDAGASWQWSSLGELDLGGDNAAGGYEGGFGVLALPSFVDRRHGWVAVLTSSDTYQPHSFLFRTTDGGATWDRLPPPPGAPRLAFSSRTTGWSVVQGGAGGLYRTADAGRSWRGVALAPPPPLRGTSVALREPPTFKSQRDGFLPVEFVRQEGGRPRILAAGFYVTADGGATWTPRYVPLAEEDEEHGLLPQAAADRRTLLALVGPGARKVLTSRTAAAGGRRPPPGWRAATRPCVAWPSPTLLLAGRSPAGAPAASTTAAIPRRLAATTAASCCAPPTAAPPGRRPPPAAEPAARELDYHRLMRVVIVGGGPGGYEAALVAADLGAEVTVVNDEGLGGACVLWDCVPSKTLLTSAQAFNTLETAPSLGVHFEGMPGQEVPRYEVDLPTIMSRVRGLALAQSEDIGKRVTAAGVRVVLGRGRVVDPHTVEVRASDAGPEGKVVERLEGDAILLATGSDPRRMDTAPTDGEVILSSQDVYKLREVPEHLVVVGAGATGAEYATAFLRFGAQVTFVVSRDRILPTHDEDAALVIEDVFERRGLVTVKNARAAKVERVGDRGVVHLEDGRTIEGSHVLLTIGQVPQTYGLGLEELGIRTDKSGALIVDGVSRTSVPSIYAAGDVTAKLMLASVAAMQGRIAMYHLLGQAVSPLRWDAVAATIFTDPQIATVGLSEQRAAETGIQVEVDTLPLGSNPRAKMSNRPDGFVKLLARPGSGTIAGGSVVASYASDLIAPISEACANRLTASQLAQAFQTYPSFAGSIQECARRLAVRVQGSYRY